MMTRLLETREIVRASVTSCEVFSVEKAALLLKTTAMSAIWKPLSSADSAMLLQISSADEGRAIEGRLRIDLLSDSVLRVRYSEGDAVPENNTPMIIGVVAVPITCEFDLRETSRSLIEPEQSNTPVAGSVDAIVSGNPVFQECQEVTIRTAKLRIAVTLKPFRIVILDMDGRKLCGIGGAEKNNFFRWDSYNTGICRNVGNSRAIAVENFDLRDDECIYGLGEKFIKLNKVGQTIDLHLADALGVTSPRSYKSVPFYVSNKRYGVFFNHSSSMSYWLGSMSATDVQVAAEDNFLDYYIFTGDVKQILSSYTDITGKGVLPPKWTFGYWQSKISYSSADETLEIAAKLRKERIPCDVIHLDTHWFKKDWYCDLEFDTKRFPDPEGYFRKLSDLGFKVSLWQLPYIPGGSNLFDRLASVGGFVKCADGSIYDLGLCFTEGFQGIVGVIDFTNPEAVKIYQDALRRLLCLGAKVIKTDFGESAPTDGVYCDGTPGSRMHNLYPLLYNKAVFDVTREVTGDGVVWARSSWAGGQRYPLHWGGDNSPNFENIIPQLQGGLSLGLSGFQFWSQDIGGFCGPTTDQLLIRWMQVGMFLSHSRIHGSGDRELYKFSPETIHICREYINLRYRLLPYIYGAAKMAVDSSLPMLRALVIEYPDDPNVWNLGDEYLFGDSLLVAPITNDETSRRIYLPKGVWTDWWTRERLHGNRWIDLTPDIERLPLFIREGGLIPMGPKMNFVDEVKVEKINLLVSLFEDDGTSSFLVSVNDGFVPVEYVYSEGRHVVTIGESNVEFTLEPLGESELDVIRN